MDEMKKNGQISPDRSNGTTETSSLETTNTEIFSDRCEPDRFGLLRQLSENVRKAYAHYSQRDAAAAGRSETFDGPAIVEIPAELDIDDWFSPAEIGAVSRNVGPGLRVDAYRLSRQLEVHSLASGFRHARACIEVNDAVAEVTRTFRRGAAASIQHSSNGTYGLNFITAPDLLLGSTGDNNGADLGDSPEAPIFFCEVEDSNRSLPALIRHCGALFVNFPNLNGVVGIKSGHPTHWAVLFVVERVAGSLELTTMLDFGPSALTDAVAQNASGTFLLPLPPPGTKPTAGQHGTDLPLFRIGTVCQTVWTRPGTRTYMKFLWP